MEKEEILLGAEMSRLEIEPVKLKPSRNSENPFISLLQKKRIFKSPIIPKETKCTCSIQRKTTHLGIHKKKHNKILKEPILKILKNCGNNSVILDAEECQDSKDMSVILRCDPLNLCTLVHNCNQLTISTSPNEQNVAPRDVAETSSKWWKSEILNSQESREPKQQSSQPGSCSQQALNPPCDVTIDELASYFETLVHIPKKMSSMAEMMYI